MFGEFQACKPLKVNCEMGVAMEKGGTAEMVLWQNQASVFRIREKRRITRLSKNSPQLDSTYWAYLSLSPPSAFEP